MARKETIDKVTAILWREESVLVIRDSSGLLSLPQVTGAKPEKLLEAFLPLTEIMPLIEEKDPVFVYEEEERFYRHHPFVASLPLNFNETENRVLLSYDDFEKADLDPATRVLLGHYFYFLPIALKRPREIPLEEEEQAKAEKMLNLLARQKKALPKKELAAFRALIEAPSSPTRIRKAFYYLGERYHLHLGGWL